MGARVGDFDIVSVIHRGEAGFVYLAADRSSSARVAVKEYLPNRFADRLADGNIGVRSLRYQTPFRNGMQGFLRQARILEDLDEPALVKTLRTWQQNGSAYMAMLLCQGETLQQVFLRSPRPSEPWLKTMLGPLLDAIAALHRARCYPCDVTARNVVVDDGGPILFDPGIVRRILARTPRGRTAVLDHGYAALEQYPIDASLTEGPWTDVYAVASVLHVAITGNPPPTPTARLDVGTLPPLGRAANGYSTAFLEGIVRGLAVRPQHRPQSIAEFRQALGIRSIESTVIDVRTSEPTPCVLSAALSETDETLAPAQADMQQPLLDLQEVHEEAKENRRRLPRKTLAASLLGGVVAGVAMFWIFSTPEKLPAAETRTAAVLLPLHDDQPAARTTDSRSAESSAPPSAATLAVATSSLPASATSATLRKVPSADERAALASVSTPSTKPVAPAPKTGTIQFAIKPWGEIVVDGKRRGMSPPIKELSVPEGRHRIEIRNSTFSGYAGEVDVMAGRSVQIAHSFTSP